MDDPRIQLAGLAIDAFQPLDLLLVRQSDTGIAGQVQRMSELRLPGTDLPVTTLNGNGTCRPRRLFERGQHNLIGVGETGLLTGQRPHAHALLDAGAAVLHDAVLERPGFLVRKLEIQVGEIDGMCQDFAEYLVQATVVQTAGPQDQITCDIQCINGLVSWLTQNSFSCEDAML